MNTFDQVSLNDMVYVQRVNADDSELRFNLVAGTIYTIEETQGGKRMGIKTPENTLVSVFDFPHQHPQSARILEHRPNNDVEAARGGIILKNTGIEDEQIPSSWAVFNAPRPLWGTRSFENREWFHGRFYAVIDPNDDQRGHCVRQNIESDGWVVNRLDQRTAEDLTRLMIGDRYWEAYQKSDDEVKWSAIENTIGKFFGKSQLTINQAKRLVEIDRIEMKGPEIKREYRILKGYVSSLIQSHGDPGYGNIAMSFATSDDRVLPSLLSESSPIQRGVYTRFAREYAQALQSAGVDDPGYTDFVMHTLRAHAKHHKRDMEVSR